MGNTLLRKLNLTRQMLLTVFLLLLLFNREIDRIYYGNIITFRWVMEIEIAVLLLCVWLNFKGIRLLFTMILLYAVFRMTFDEFFSIMSGLSPLFLLYNFCNYLFPDNMNFYVLFPVHLLIYLGLLAMLVTGKSDPDKPAHDLLDRD